MRGVARQEVGWQGRRPANSDVAHCGITSTQPDLLAPSRHANNARRSQRTAIQKRRQGHLICRCSRRVARRRRKSKERSSHRLCAIAVGRNGYRWNRRGGWSRGRGGGRGRQRPWDSRRGVSTPGRWSMSPAGPKGTDSRGCVAGCCCCTSARPSGGAVRTRLRRRRRRRARRGRGGYDQAGGLDGVGPLCRTP